MPFSCQTPLRLGPRHWGHSAAKLSMPNNAAKIVTNADDVTVIILLPLLKNHFVHYNLTVVAYRKTAYEATLWVVFHLTIGQRIV
jgi:hypothetical protein